MIDTPAPINGSCGASRNWLYNGFADEVEGSESAADELTTTASRAPGAPASRSTPGAVRPGVRFGAGVLPLVVAWVGLIVAQMVSPSLALVVLVVGYLATVLTEHWAAQRQFVPSGYVWIHWGFSIVAVVMMVMVLVLREVGQTIVF